MITKKDWHEGIKAWEKIKKQSEIDIAQADLYIAAIKTKIKEMK